MSSTPSWLVELAAPAEVLPEQARTLDGHLVPASADMPALMVTVTAEPGGAARLALARVPSGGNVEPAELGVDLPGEVEDVEAASSVDLVAVVGTLDDAGQIRPYVLTSQDRSTWRLAEDFPDLVGHSVATVAVTGTSVLLATYAAAGTGHLTAITGDTVTTTQLEAHAGADVWPGSVAASGDDVVVVGSARLEGSDTWSPALWTSRDGGATFAAGTIPEPDAASLAVVRAKDAWVMTGTLPGKGGRRPASWSSPDAAAWKADRRWKPGKITRGDEHKLGIPTVGPNGRVLVWLSDADFGGNVYERSQKGRWRPVSPEPMSDAPEPDADARLTVGADGATLVLRVVASWAQLQRSTSDAWEPVALVSPHDPVREVASARPAGDAVEVTLAHRRHRNGEYVSTSQTEHERIQVGDEVLPIEMPPGLARAESATDPATGAQVTMGLTPFDPSDIEEPSPSPSLWLRTLLIAADGTVSRPPLDLSSMRAVDHISHFPGVGYVAALDEAKTFDDAGQVAFAHSRDGEAWTVTTASTLGESSAEGSSAWDTCALPDGKVVALGESADKPATWVFDGSAWTRSATDALPAAQHLETCVSTPEGAVVTTVDDDALTRLWTTTDGLTFTPAGELPDEGRMRSISRAGSTYVAAGRVTTADYAGNVVWLSQDAVTWRRVELPARGMIVTHARGSDAIVVVGHVGGPRIFRLDVEEAWDAAQVAHEAP